MFNAGKAGVNIGKYFRPKESVHGISVLLEYSRLLGVVFWLPWQTVPIVPIAEDDRVCVGQEEICNGDAAKSYLRLVYPSSFGKRLFGCNFDIRRFIFLVRQLPDTFAGVRAGVSDDGFRVRSELFAAYAAGVMRHVVQVVFCILALSLGIPTFTGTKADFGAWLFNCKWFSAKLTRSFCLARAATYCAQLLAVFVGELATAQSCVNFGLVFGGNDSMRTTMHESLVDEGGASRVSTKVFRTWHLINS